MEMETNSVDDARYVFKMFRDCEQARSNQDADSYNNFAALYGHQYTEWSEVGRYYVNYLAIGRADERVRITVNKIKPIMQARATFIIGENPNISIDSDSPEVDDKEAAYIAQRVARADWEQNNLYGLCQDAWEWVKPCGLSYVKTYYDPNAGKYLGYWKEGKRHVFEGRVRSKVYPKFAVFTDPLATTWDEVQYVIIANIISRERVDRMGLNINYDELSGDVWATSATQVMDLINQLERPELIMMGDTKDQKGKKRNLLMLEYYERPCKEYPLGRFMQVIGDKVIKKGELPFGEFPIVPFIDSTVAGTINGQTPVSEMRPVQELLNKIVSLDYERSMLPDIYAFPLGGRWPKKFGTKAVIVGEYRPGAGEPKFVQAGVNRPDYLMKMKYYEEWLENLAGVSAISSRADAPSSMSGRMGYILTDANRVLLSGIKYRFQRSVSDLIRLRLKFMSKYYDDERMMSFINEYDKREVVRFTGKEIGDNWSVYVRFAESNNDPNARAQRILQLFSNQIVVQELMKDPVSMRKALVGIDPEIGHEYFISETDTDVARDENFEFSQGGDPAVMPWNNDQTHSVEHKRQLDSDTLRKWRPEYVNRLQIHWIKHQMQAAAKMREQMMMQMMMTQQAQAQQGEQGKSNAPGVPGATPMPGAPESPVQAIDQNLEQQTQGAYPGYQPGAPTGMPVPGGGG